MVASLGSTDGIVRESQDEKVTTSEMDWGGDKVTAKELHPELTGDMDTRDKVVFELMARIESLEKEIADMKANPPMPDGKAMLVELRKAGLMPRMR